MKILTVARNYLLNGDVVASYCAVLNRELAKRDWISAGQVALLGFNDFALRRAQPRPPLPLGAGWVQPNLRTNVFPILFQQSAPRAPDLDSDAAVRVFGRSFAGVLSAWRPQIVHVHGPASAVHREAVVLARRSGSRVVFTQHASPERRPGGDDGRSLRDDIDTLCIPWPAPAGAPDGPAVVLSPSVDLSFWQPALVQEERSFWRASAAGAGNRPCLVVGFLPPLDDPRGSLTMRGMIASLYRLRLQGMTTAVLLVISRRPGRAHPGWPDAWLPDSLPAGCAVEVVAAPTRRLIRSLLAASDAAVFPSRLPVGTCTPLDAMAMGCPVIVADDGFGRALVGGATGVAYPPERASDLATAIVDMLQAPGGRDRIRHAARETAAVHSFAALAEEYLEIYGQLTQKGTSTAGPRPASDRRARAYPASSEPHSAAGWIRRATLALDLDGTLITPCHAWRRPTAFPLLRSARVTLDCEEGKTYFVRAGLKQLGAILDLPWRSRLVWSTAPQDKVDEIGRKVVVAGVPLGERMDACVGSELLREFAASRGLTLPSSSARSVTNWRGRRVVAKPSQFLFLDDLTRIGEALRSGNRRLATEIATRSSLHRGYGLMIDDQPYFTPELSCVSCYRVIPFTSIEKSRNLLSDPGMPSVHQFEFLDHIWRAGASPFGYLHHVLAQAPDFPRVTIELDVEAQLIEASRHTNNLRQFSWVKERAYASTSYHRYAASRPRKRAIAERSRIREHVKIYRMLTRQIVLKDLKRNWLVLMLGRDMDYAFEFFKTLCPYAVTSGQVALLPLSRRAIEASSPQVVLQLILDRLPALRVQGVVGVKIYDIGFHGHIPRFIRNALASTLPGKQVRAQLLNACRCNKSALGSCFGRQCVFRDARGKFRVDRTLGLSIERCPHTQGTLERVTVEAGQFVFEHSAVTKRERERANTLLALVRELASRCRSQESPPAALGGTIRKQA